MNQAVTTGTPTGERSWLAALCLSRFFFNLIYMAYAATLPTLTRAWDRGGIRTDLFFHRVRHLFVLHVLVFGSHRCQADIPDVLLARGGRGAALRSLRAIVQPGALAVCPRRFLARWHLYSGNHAGLPKVAERAARMGSRLGSGKHVRGLRGFHQFVDRIHGDPRLPDRVSGLRGRVGAGSHIWDIRRKKNPRISSQMPWTGRGPGPSCSGIAGPCS